ncbi:hypothetical protein ACHWQZ_G014129 [Mnemiopsis leidyi]
MFYSNVKKLVELPASPLGFLKNFCRRDEKSDFDRNNDISRGSPGRRSLREHKNHGLQGIKSRYRSEPALPFSDEPQHVITAATLPEILMASLHHQQVHVTSSEPHSHSPHHHSDRSRPNSASEPPSSPREGKRKRLTHEASSPNVTAKQRKHSAGAKGRHSIVIEPPKICTAWDANSQSDIAQSRSDTSSLHSEISVESFVELDEKALKKIKYIVEELIMTEKTYMQDLQDIVMGYMAPMELCDDLFEPSTVKDIFINIKPIGDFHLNFLEKLDEYKKDLDLLANCFLTKESEEGFALYNEFCRKVPRSLDLIAGMMKDPQTLQFIQDCKQQLNHFFPLSEFLHRPIQRILKYPLLLRDLQKYTAGTKYASCIDAALDKITGVAIHINKVKRVQELESHEILGWTGEPLLEYGVLKLEQAFKVNGTDGRYLFLFEKLLLFTKQKDGKYQYKAHLLPSDIGMTEGDKNEVKFEIEKFKAQKRTKFVVQAPSLDIKATWVYEIKRSVLENQDNITPQMREVLLKGIPSMDKTNQFNDILHNSKYTSFIYLQGFEQNDDEENGPPTPDLDSVSQNQVISPNLKSPPPESTFTYSSPSPDRQIHDDSGIEDPPSNPPTKNTVDYSSLDVKAIKDRWKQQEKLASSNTAPVRNFHRRMSPAIAAKLETWPVPDADDPAEIIKRNSKVIPLSSGNVHKSASGDDVAKPCLARISHLQEAKEKAGPLKRDIKSLIAEDAAKSQTHYDMLSPDSNNHPDCEGGNLFSALDNSRHHVVSPKQSNGSDDVFLSSENKSSNTMKTNLNDKKDNKKWKDQEPLELSDNDEMIVKFTKGCNISGTNTAKRNSFLIEKDLQKTVPNFTPQSSDSETASESEATAARVDKIKRMANKHKQKIKAETDHDTELDGSLTDTLMGLYDQQSSKYRTPSPFEDHEMVNKMASLSTKDETSGRTTRTATTKDTDDKTLTRDENTLTRDKDTLTRENITYKGSSLIRGGTPDNDNEIVMKPIRDTASPRTLTRNRLHRRAQKRGGKSDSDSESESTSSGSKSSSAIRSFGLQKPSANRSNSGSPVVKSDSAGSVQSYRSRTGSNKAEQKSSNTTKPVPGSVVQSATVKKAALRARNPSFNQDDNPFLKGVPCTRTDSDPVKSVRAQPDDSSARRSVGTPTKSVPIDSPVGRSRGTRHCSEGIAADRRSAYLSAAQSSTNSSKNDSDPEIQELNSIRSSQLVARMKSQFQANSK